MVVVEGLAPHHLCVTSHASKRIIRNRLEENLLDIIGRPVHVKSIDGGKYQIGIQFDDLDKNATKMLQKYISDGDTSQ